MTLGARPTRSEVLAVAALSAGLALFHAGWWWAHRRGMPWFIDDAGYLTFAIDHAAALRDGGVSAFVRSLDHQAPYAPLVPAVTGVLIAVTDRPFASSLVVTLLGTVLLVVAAWLLARTVLPARWAVLAAAVAATLPGPLVLGHAFYFAVPAAGFVTLALACTLRIRERRARWWAVGAGLSLGLALLTRTMTVGFVPALAAALLVQTSWGRSAAQAWRRVLVTTGLAVAACAILAAPWYLPNAGIIRDDLTNSGIFSGGGQPGGGARIVGARDLRLLVVETHLTGAIALGAVAVAGLVVWLRRSPHPLRRARGRPEAVLVAAVLAGGLTLLVAPQSTGQWLPLLPVLAVLAVRGASLIEPPSWQRGAVVLLAATATLHLAGASQEIPWLSRARSVSVAGVGALPVTDARSPLERQLGVLLDGGDRLPGGLRRVRPALGELVAAGRAAALARGEVPVMVLRSPADALVNVNSLKLEDRLAAPAPHLITGALGVGDDATPEVIQPLLDDEHGRPNLVLSLPPRGARSPAGAVHEQLAAVLPGLGFELIARVDVGDGRTALLWFRAQADSVSGAAGP